MMVVRAASGFRLPASAILGRCALLLALLTLCGGCGPQHATAQASFDFLQGGARAQLAAQAPPQLLTQVGGALPDLWPDTAPPLLVDLQLLQRSRVTLSNGAGTKQGFSALRLTGVRAQVSGDPGGALTPRPSELLLFLGAAGAESLSDASVKRFARGAFPLLAELRPCDDPPASLCVDPLPASDAGPLSVENELLLEPQAQGAIERPLLDAGALELLLLLREPIDTSVQPLAPRGNAHLVVTLDFELVP